jgi:hypothetical protein
MFRQIHSVCFRFEPALGPKLERRGEDGGVVIEDQGTGTDRCLLLGEHMYV